MHTPTPLSVTWCFKYDNDNLKEQKAAWYFFIIPIMWKFLKGYNI